MQPSGLARSRGGRREGRPVREAGPGLRWPPKRGPAGGSRELIRPLLLVLEGLRMGASEPHSTSGAWRGDAVGPAWQALRTPFGSRPPSPRRTHVRKPRRSGRAGTRGTTRGAGALQDPPSARNPWTHRRCRRAGEQASRLVPSVSRP